MKLLRRWPFRPKFKGIPLDWSKIYNDKQYDSKTPMSCLGCGNTTSNRVETTQDTGEMLGEDPQLLWAPICKECIDGSNKV